MSTALRMRPLLAVLVLFVLAGVPAFAQMETATLSGVINDPNGRVVPDVEVTATRIETGTVVTTKTNGAGIYFFTGLMPGHYHLLIHKLGFKEIAIKEFQLYVQDKLEQNFSLEIGSVSETVTVTAGTPLINTTDATVSTVVDRQFAENIPMNGRSIQSLIQLTPGVVVVPSNGADSGQFSVNGQRAASNILMVDGVSANIGITAGSSTSPGNGFGGALGSFSAQGGTNSLVSVDALQEFRIQTSTYAPEFGRTPGGQISIVTRSGTNQFHGTAFDYLRNDKLDANDWFANSQNLPKPEERQNDFGGTFSGPILKDKTFFFFSYEGLRLRLPRVGISRVPNLNARQSAIPALQPFLNAYPFDPKQPDLGNGIAQFNASFSNKSTLDAYSLRADHKLFHGVTLFGRYNYSPSELVQRGAAARALSDLSSSRITTQTATVGTTWAISPMIVNDFRFNFSRVEASSSSSLDNFGGAVPLSSLPVPSPYTAQNAAFQFRIIPLTLSGALFPGKGAQNLQRQINIVDTLSLTKRSHAFKFGADFRRLSPEITPPLYLQVATVRSVLAAQNGNPFSGIIQANTGATVLFRNLGAFAQDTWRVLPRLTLTYGLRWDLDIAPESLSGPGIPAVTGYNLNDFSQLAVAPAGTVPFQTTYGNVAPRVGLAYQLTQSQNRETVIRGGFGVFYDLVSSETGTVLGFPPFGALKSLRGSFPFSAASSAPPVIPGTGILPQLFAFNPNLKLPYTLEWNFALEQGLGRQQTISASYIGASGRRLLQTALILAPPSNPTVGSGGGADFVDNTASSNYNALQVQFQRRLSHGLQVLASYGWAHSIDDGSAGSPQLRSNQGAPGIGANANRGSSDFDIRQTFSAGMTYDISVPRMNAFADTILRGWSLQSMILARSAPPVDISDANLFQLSNGASVDVRPDIVSGQPFYLRGSAFPGGKAFNPNAFQDPPTNPAGCLQSFAFPCVPARQGNVPRNFLRGFGATQWDFGVHREFPIRESVKLQFRAEMFNVLNHPNFGPPSGSWPLFGFGVSQKTLGQFLDGGGGVSNVGGGAFSSLYQVGGPRSIQLALKLFF